MILTTTRKKLAIVSPCMIVNERRYTNANHAAWEIAELIKIRLRRRWENKIGRNPNDISWIVFRLHLAEDRAFRRVLPICEKVLGENLNEFL